VVPTSMPCFKVTQAYSASMAIITLLFPNGVDPVDFVMGLLTPPISQELILPGFTGANLFTGTPNTPVLAVKVDFCLRKWDKPK